MVLMSVAISSHNRVTQLSSHKKILRPKFFDVSKSGKFFSELCWGKAMVTKTRPHQERNEKAESRGRYIKRIHFRFERGQVLGFRKGRRNQAVSQPASFLDEG